MCDECYCDSPTFGNRAAAAIASALGEGVLPQLEVLDLHGTCVGDAGVVLLARTLERLGDACRLECLDISGRVLDSPDARGLPEAARLKKKGGMAALVDALLAGACPRLRELRVSTGYDNTKTAAQLLAALRKRGASFIEGSWPRLVIS